MKIKLSTFVGRRQLPGDEVAFSRLEAAFGPASPPPKKSKKATSPQPLNSQRRSRADEDARLTLVI